MSVDTVTAIAQTALAAASLASTVTLAVLVYIATRRVAQIESDRIYREGWNNLNALALASDDALRAADSLLPHESQSNAPLNDVRRKWLAYVLINTLADTYMGARNGWSANRQFALDNCTHHLTQIVKQDDLYELTQRGYEEEFMQLCRSLRATSSSPVA